MHTNQKGLAHIAIIILLVILAFVALAGWKVYGNRHTTEPSNINSGGQTNQPSPTKPYGEKITVTGTSSCLPHTRNNGGQETLECATAIKTDDGKYYGLAGSVTEQLLIPGSGRVKVTGTLSASTDGKYISEGTITVTKVEKL